VLIVPQPVKKTAAKIGDQISERVKNFKFHPNEGSTEMGSKGRLADLSAITLDLYQPLII
jgi:hypothetical protein